MLVCIGVYLVLLWQRKRNKKVLRVLFVANTIALLLFAADMLEGTTVEEILRNDYGKGSRVEQYEVTIEGELVKEPIEIEVEERTYTGKETQAMFSEMMEELDVLVLGENKSADHVEENLYLPSRLDGYPVDIQWELDNYQVLDPEGRIVQEKTSEKGTLVEVKGILTYGEREAIYVTNVKVYPKTKTGKEKWISDLQEMIAKQESLSREEKEFSLPSTLNGKGVRWERKSNNSGYVVLVLGVVVGGLLVWNEKQDAKEKRQRRRESMERDYPDLISKFVMLLDTGMTVKQVWTKIVTQYEEHKAEWGERDAYEEMKHACHEMQSGIPEAEAYERFGNRCDSVPYLKFGVLLSQNLRKGSKGLCDLLRVESIQAFEGRKSTAKRKGEEASAKLMLPMIGMLAVVLMMVVVPAFLSMQI